MGKARFTSHPVQSRDWRDGCVRCIGFRVKAWKEKGFRASESGVVSVWGHGDGFLLAGVEVKETCRRAGSRSKMQ